MEKSLVATRLVNLLKAVLEIAPVTTLTNDETKLLERLITRWQSLTPACLADIADEKDKNSTYKRLLRLQQKGFVAIHPACSDTCRRHIAPSNGTIAYLMQKGASFDG